MSSTPTIAFLRRGYSATGGAEAYLSRLASGLQEEGFHTVLLGTGDWPQQEWPGEEIKTLSRLPITFAKEALAYQQEKKGTLLFSMERVPGCDLFRAGDGVHAAWLDLREGRKKVWNGLLSEVAAGNEEQEAAARRPAVYRNILEDASTGATKLFVSGVELWKKSTKWWQQHCSRHRSVLALERKLYDPSAKTHIIANSHMVARQIEEYFGFPQEKMSVIPNGVPSFKPFTESERQAVRAHFKMKKEEYALLFVGSGWERKGLKVALEGVERANAILKERSYPSIMKLWIAGKGNPHAYQSPYAHFLGPVKKVEYLYAAADLFLLPTLYDPFSNASLEALAAGLPVITTRWNGCSEVMQEGTHGSILSDPTDAAACATALVEWYKRLQNPSAVHVTREQCASLGGSFSVEKNLQATIALILQVLHERQKLK